jgi:hypothetical protein
MTQNAIIAIEEGNRTLTGTSVTVTLIVKYIATIFAQITRIDGQFPFCPHHHRAGDFFIINLEQGGL